MLPKRSSLRNCAPLLRLQAPLRTEVSFGSRAAFPKGFSATSAVLLIAADLLPRPGRQGWASMGSGPSHPFTRHDDGWGAIGRYPWGYRAFFDVLGRSAPRLLAICAQQQLRSQPHLA